MEKNSTITTALMFFIVGTAAFSPVLGASTQTMPESNPEATFTFKAESIPPSKDWTEGGAPRENGNFIDANHVWFGLGFTQDGGKTWKQMIITPEIKRQLGYEKAGVQPVFGVSNLRIFFLDEKHGWLSPRDGGNAVWQTEDGGYKWLKIFNERYLEPPFFLPDKKHGWFFSTHTNYNHWPNHEHYVFKTDNGGKTWSRETSHVPNKGFLGNVYFIDATIGYATLTLFPNKNDERVTSYGIAKTIDSGRTWKLLWISPDSDERYIGLQFINEKEGWIWSALPDAAYHTNDGGRTWRRRDDTSYLRPGPGEFYFINSRKGWLLSSSIADESVNSEGDFPLLCQTMDGGKNWEYVGRKEILSNPKFRSGSNELFPNWREGNYFLFFIGLSAKEQ